MRIGAVLLNPYTFQNIVARKVTESSESQLQVQQAMNTMMQILEFAFYKQQDMNLKLVRIVGELYQGKKLDVLA
ncbi:MAG: hypothetical protein N2Z58_04205 [Fervidobacterium sp.]|nr:hypothetical protein [Fervidobacterium sp.]